MSVTRDAPHADEDRREARMVGPGPHPPHDHPQRTVGFGWVEGGLIFLATGQLLSGAWALFSPAGFYEDYPGWGWAWVRADGPFNEHLVVDAGTGFVTVGMALLIAAFTRFRQVRLLALVIYLAAGLPHLVYHIGHVPETLGRVEGQLTWVALALGAILALFLPWRDLRSARER